MAAPMCWILFVSWVGAALHPVQHCMEVTQQKTTKKQTNEVGECINVDITDITWWNHGSSHQKIGCGSHVCAISDWSRCISKNRSNWRDKYGQRCPNQGMCVFYPPKNVVSLGISLGHLRSRFLFMLEKMPQLEGTPLSDNKQIDQTEVSWNGATPSNHPF